MSKNTGAGIEKSLLAVFAKLPSAGHVKTRLALRTSAEWAQTAAQAMLEDSLDRFATIDAVRAIVYSPADATSHFDKLSQGRYELIPQTDGNLGQRLRSFFDWAQDNYGRIVVVGADSPTLPIHYVTDAIRSLEKHDVVIGPASDGGSYLIGLNKVRVRPFADISWGTSRVFEEIMQRLGGNEKVALLAPWYDIDTVDDWAMLRGHVKGMRRAGLDPGAPRVERLINEGRDFV